MANFIYFAGTRYDSDTTWLAEYYGAQTATTFEILDSSAILRSSYSGYDFTYSSTGFFKSGTIRSEHHFSSNGQLVEQVTNLDIDVASRNSMLSIGTSSYNYYQYKLRNNDVIQGSAEDDSFLGSKGNDTINGGAGIDVLTYKQFGQAVTVNLSTGRAITSYGTSKLSTIEDIEGSTYSDTLTGNAQNNQIQGFAGADKISGGLGFDTAVYFDASSAININLATGVVSGGSGNDTLTSIERILGSRFNDILLGSNANESFLGGFGSDTINGANGVDTVEYGYVGSGVSVNLNTGLASGGAGNDVLSNIENIKGSIFADTLIGNALGNSINGNAGNDQINGLAGNDNLNGSLGHDRLAGGIGKDTLSGGIGNDIFDFNALSELGVGTSRDIVTDFVKGQDKIDLSSIDTNTTLSGDQKFSLVTAFNAAGQVRYTSGIISINTDVDLTAEYEIQLTGSVPASLSASDFVL